MSDADDMRMRRPAGEPPSESIVALLRARRESMGLSTADLAKTLRIRQIYIDALEEGRTELLPGSAYAFGFVRTYARFVGMDGERAVQQFKDEAKHIPAQTPLVLPKALTESRTPGFAALLVGALLLAAAYGAWTVWGDRVAPPPAPTIAPPPPLAAPVPPPPEPPPVAAAPSPDVLPMPVPAPETTAAVPMAAPPAPIAPPVALSTPAVPVVPTAAGVPGPEAAAVPLGPQYVVRAGQASWVEIRAGDGKVLVSRVLAPGESVSVPVDPRARMVTGNAGGVTIEAEGRVSEPLGRIGQVIRDIPLEPKARAAFFAVPRETTTAPPPPPGE